MEMTAYLSFKGNCEAAFKFYEQCLGARPGSIFRYGDRFGIPWLINCEGATEAANA